MALRSMTYPLGQAIVPAMLVRRSRPVPPGATVRVQAGESITAEQPIATLPTGDAVLAGVAGRVMQVLPGQVVIEGLSRLVHGMLGLGAQVAGPLTLAPRPDDPGFASAVPRGGILLVPQRLSSVLVQRAVQAGASGVVAGSMSARDLESFARADVTSLLDGAAAPPPLPLTLFLTDGIGEEAMDARFMGHFSGALGRVVLVSGITRVRPLVRPEVLLPAAEPLPTGVPLPHTFELGARVHVHAGQQRGAQGEIIALPSGADMIENHLVVRCAYVRVQDGTVLRVPLHALDRVS